MKNVLLIATFVGISGLVHATTINAPSSLIGSDSLSGQNAYSWGISIAVPNGQTITSAEVDFTSVTLSAANNSGTGYLYTDLLKSTATGVTTVTDNDAPGDYWATSGLTYTSLGSQFFKSVGTTLSFSYVFNSTQLAALNSYLTAGTFNIGIDPDCHYTVGGLSFTYTTSTSHGNSVPDVTAAAFLLALGLGGLEVFRRRLVAVKVNA